MKYNPSYSQARVYVMSNGGTQDCTQCGERILIGDPVADVDGETFHADCAQEVLDMEG